MHPGVFLFVAEGCPACHEFLPRFKNAAAPARARGVPIGIYDLARDRHARYLAQKLAISATPTTIVLTRAGKLRRYIGGITATEVKRAIASI
jgi:hypothetical protein